MKFFEQIKVSPQQDNLAETCRILLQHVDTATSEDDEDSESEMQSASVLFHACAVAKQLSAVEVRLPTWAFVQNLWIEIELCWWSM